jgi:lipid A ethanolaminephosphotransferase
VRYNQLQAPGLCPDGACYDEAMLHGLQARIDQLPAARRARGVVVFMHQMGSHGPAYYKRDPPQFKRFLPECATNALQQCSHEELINAFDNTIVYTDDFLASVIGWLGQQQDHWATALSYISDHGESLGENGIYLHGMPWRLAPDVQKHIAWITWLSPRFTAQTGITAACLNAKRDARLSHDNYFHSVLGLLGVQTSLYRAPLDIFASCRREPAATTAAAPLSPSAASSDRSPESANSSTAPARAGPLP